MPSKLGDVGKLPTSNELGNVGEAQNNAQHLQNTRQHSANYRSAQTQYPSTAAGQDAFHAWNQRNPAPVKQDLGQQQQKVQNYVDQELVARGAGPGFAHAQARLQGQQPVAPQRAEADQHAEHNQVMADIKREQANGGIQNSRVNTVNPSKRVDISGERRRIEKENKWPVGSMDQGGANYAANGPRSAQLVQQNGPTGIPQAPVAAPTPPPVAQATPAPTGYQWKSKEAEKMYNDSVNKPNSGYNGNINMGGGSLGGAAAQRPQISSLSPEQGNALSNFQAQNNARMKAEGSTRPPDDYTKLSPGEQKYVHDFNLERGNIPRPVRPPTGQVPNPRNPNKDMNDRPMLPKPTAKPQAPPPIGGPVGDTSFGGFGSGIQKLPPIGGPVGDTSFGGASLAPNPEQKQEKLNQRAKEMLARPSDASLEKQAKAHEASLYPKPSTPISREIDFQEKTPNSAEMMEDRRSRAYTGNSGADKIRDNVPEFGESFGAQQVRPKSENEKLPTIKKSSPITDTIKASNTPIPSSNTPKPTQQPIAQRKPLFPRLGGRLRK